MLKNILREKSLAIYFRVSQFRRNGIFNFMILLDFSLTVKAATLIFISGCGSAISSAKEGKSGFI